MAKARRHGRGASGTGDFTSLPMGAGGEGVVVDDAPGTEDGAIAFANGTGATPGNGANGHGQAHETHAPVIENLGDVTRELERTQAALATLATGVHGVLERQDRASRRVSLSSFGAYAIFTVLLATGFVVLYRMRAAGLSDERDRAIAAHTKAAAELETLRASNATRAAAATQAAALWAVVEAGRKDELVARAAEAKAPGLSPVESAALTRAVHDARRGMVDDAVAAAQASGRAGKWAQAAEAYRGALAVADETTGQKGALGYRLGVALLRAGDHEGASRALTDAIPLGGEKEGPDLYFLLGSANEARRDDVHAAEAYQKFVDGHPNHSMAPSARARLVWIAARSKK